MGSESQGQGSMPHDQSAEGSAVSTSSRLDELHIDLDAALHQCSAA